MFLCYPEKAFASSTANISETSFPLHSPQVFDVETFTVSFRNEICQNEELVGGKAKSLALLSSIETNDVCDFCNYIFHINYHKLN